MIDEKKTAGENPSPAGVASVLVVDDHPAVREGLATRISRQPDLEICGEAEDIPEALRLLEERRPDVAVVDVALRDGNGIDLVRRIRARDARVRILVWSMYPESLYAERALRAGANGYATKEQETSRIVAAIRDILRGRIVLTEQAADRMLRRAVGATPSPGSPVDSLSDREFEVFDLIGRGLKTGEISVRLNVSVNTIETHRQRIKAKLGLASGAELGREAVQWVLENG